MARKIILLNGPKESGKDTLGHGLQTVIPEVHIFKFAEPIRKHICEILQIPEHDLDRWKSLYHDRLGMTVREAMIDYSENYMKPMFGDEIFGEILLDKLERTAENAKCVITDSGFLGEAKFLYRSRLFEDPKQIILVRITREGHDFAGDSRGYLDPADLPGIHFIDFVNEDGVEESVAKLANLVQMCYAE